MKLRTFAVYTLLVGVLVVSMISYSVGFGDIFSTIMHASVIFIICYLMASILIAVVLTFKWQLILHAKGISIPFSRLFVYRLVGYSVSYLTPTAHAGGEPIRAYLLKREGVPITTAFSTIIIDKSTELMVDVLFFFIAALFILHNVTIYPNMKLFIIIVAFILVLLMAMFIAGILRKGSMFVRIFRFLRLHTFERLNPVERNLAKVENEIEDFYKHKREYFYVIILIVAFLWVLMYFEYRFALLIFGYSATPLDIFLILTGVGLAYAIPIPAAMGTLELGQISAAKVLNLSSATGIALAFLIRARDLVWTVIGLIGLSFYKFDFENLAKETKAIDRRFEKGDLFKKN